MNPWEPLEREEAIDCLQSKASSAMQKVASVAYLTDVELMSDKDIAQHAFISPSSIRHMRRVALRLDTDLAPLLHQGALSLAHAKAIAGLATNNQRPMVERCLAGGWSVPKLQHVIREGVEYESDDQKRQFAMIAERMAEQIGFEVKVKPQGGSTLKGTIEMKYHSLDDFDAICHRLGIELDL